MIAPFMALIIINVDALKVKAIKQYEAFLQKIKRGYKPDYKDILDLICFINLPVKLDNAEFIKQKLLNQNDTAYLYFSK